MNTILYQIRWGLLGGALFALFTLGWPIAFLVVFQNWSPNMSPESMGRLMDWPGMILGIAAWVATLIYSQRRLKRRRRSLR